MKVRFLAVDGFNLIRRIFEARHVQSAADMGSVVDAARSSLQRALGSHNPTHAAVVLEAHDRTWRHLLYTDYKANRSATPELLLSHLDDFSAAFSELKVSTCSVESYEADDVIATIAAVVASHEGSVVILSTDKVYLQMITERVVVCDHFGDRVYGREQVEAQLHIPVSQYTDYLALVGDKSNNVKGVPGIGPKSAVELLQKFETLELILSSDVDDKLVKKVQGAADEARRCRQLVQLKTDVELGRNLKSFRL
ncbi:MAG: flap endonuclease Xni [Gammaproteobacteria bacterium]|jgi:protein Xni|nr:flap endonuclease Xni [Gammaproteobacteria bacterium]MBT4493681.1 flap endonuclease Xni [Gammaproteobacteria bacterium]